MALQSMEQPVCSYRRSGLDNGQRVTAEEVSAIRGFAGAFLAKAIVRRQFGSQAALLPDSQASPSGSPPMEIFQGSALKSNNMEAAAESFRAHFCVQVEDFACMLESLFSGHSILPVEPVEKTEPKWTRVELDHAINSLKMNKK